MSIRLWLRLADCWQCGASVELSEEQQQEALRLLEAQQQTRYGGARRAAWSDPVMPQPEPAPATHPAPTPPARTPPPRQQPAVLAPPRIAATGTGPSVGLAWRDWFADPTAWLVSTIVHMLLIILLGMWGLYQESNPPRVILALSFSTERDEGESEVVLDADPLPELDPPDDRADEIKEPNQVLPSAPLELPDVPPVEIPPPSLNLGDVVRQLNGGGSTKLGPLLAGRSEGIRQHLVQRDGGTSESEAAVARALVWLARHQNSDGSWSLDRFHETHECNGQCDHPGVMSDTGATALALLPFLGAGQTHLHGKHREVVSRGLGYLLRVQRKDGDLSGPGQGQMYAHGQCAIVLCEALALTRHDELLREPAQRAIDFIVNAQHTQGGWRYKPGQPGDTSVVGWQLMALRSAQMAYLKVPETTFTKAQRFLDSVQPSRSVGQFAYMPGHGVDRNMTAEGLLCRQYSGWKQKTPPLVRGVDWLISEYPPTERNFEMYYLYYATQVMHHMGGEAWKKWNPKVRDLLIAKQERKGHQAGSWRPEHGHDMSGGRLYMTSLAACTLEVYYRHLPLYGDRAISIPSGRK